MVGSGTLPGPVLAQMASLYARKDDAQALKPFIAACIAGKQLLFTSVTDASSARSKASNPFGTSTVAYLTPDGIQLTEANAISKLLGEKQHQEEDWSPPAHASCRMAPMQVARPCSQSSMLRPWAAGWSGRHASCALRRSPRARGFRMH